MLPRLPVMTPTAVPRPDAQELAAAGLALSVEGPVATVTLDRQEVRNAQTPAMWRMLATLGESLVTDDAVRVVVDHARTIKVALEARPRQAATM